MKKLIVIIITVNLLTSCDGSRRGSHKDLFPGVYVRYSEHEFGKEHDTIVIGELNDEFQITRKWRYERMVDGQTEEPTYKQETTTAFYDDKYRILHENETGNRISLDPNEGSLFIGSTKYIKLKQ